MMSHVMIKIQHDNHNISQDSIERLQRNTTILCQISETDNEKLLEEARELSNTIYYLTKELDQIKNSKITTLSEKNNIERKLSTNQERFDSICSKFYDINSGIGKKCIQ